MASKTCFSLALFLALNLLFFAIATATCTCPHPPKSKPPHKPKPKPKPKPTPCPPSNDHQKCPRDTLKIGFCAKLLDNDFLKIIFGKPPVTPCCTLIEGLADFEAALCLCSAIKTSVLGIGVKDIPVSLNLLINNCGREIPPGFQCA